MDLLQPYVLICESDREQFVAVIDQTPLVRNWLTFLPNAVAFVSPHDAVTLGDYIRGKLPGKPFMFMPIASSLTGGLLPPHVWEFINNPKDSGKWMSATLLGSPAGSPANAFSTLKRGLPPTDSFANILFPPDKK